MISGGDPGLARNPRLAFSATVAGSEGFLRPVDKRRAERVGFAGFQGDRPGRTAPDAGAAEGANRMFATVAANPVAPALSTFPFHLHTEQINLCTNFID